MSFERQQAYKMARTYGPKIAALRRDERVAWLKQQIAALTSEMERQDAEHKASCPACQSGDPSPFRCLAFLQLPREDKKLSWYRTMIGMEAADQEYAARWRVYGDVDQDRHIDGFCAYWQNVRHRLFVVAGWRCNRCKRQDRELQAHHPNYDTLGFEEIEDLEALCDDCHAEESGRISMGGSAY